MRPVRHGTLLAFAALVFLSAAPSHADEGMWTFDNFPADALRARYGASITPTWLDQVRLSTVRLTGCTGSFVSPDGLILTNHHCSAGCISDLSTAERDYLAKGYLAGARSDIAGLPAAVRAPAQAWIARVQARETALAAARELAETAVAALAKAGL